MAFGNAGNYLLIDTA